MKYTGNNSEQSPWHSNCRFERNRIMKGSIFITAGVAIIAAAIYYWRTKHRSLQQTFPEKENERHHLTNVFSKAKEVAIGN